MIEQIPVDSHFRLRQTSINDADALADFNIKMFNPTLRETIRLMINGIYPTVQAEDFILIEDTQIR